MNHNINDSTTTTTGSTSCWWLWNSSSDYYNNNKYNYNYNRYYNYYYYHHHHHLNKMRNIRFTSSHSHSKEEEEKEVSSSSSLSLLLSSSSSSSLLSSSSSSTSTSSSSSSSLSPHLTTWYTLTKHIPITAILPIGFGNINELSNHNAFFGDKRLNLHIALLLRRRCCGSKNNNNSIIDDDTSNKIDSTTGTLPSVGTVTQIQSIAMSNPLLASLIPIILPYHMTTISHGNIYTTYIIQPKQQQIHDAATMIEAAVDYITTTSTNHHHHHHHLPTLSSQASSSQTSSSSSSSSSLQNDNNNNNNNNDNDENSIMIETALNELAQFLIDHAQQTLTLPVDDLTNPNNHNNNQDLLDQDQTNQHTGIQHHQYDHLYNPKSELLNHGGTMTCQRLEGYPDHAPQFTATAYLEDITTTVYHGRNKRETEQSAAAMLWRYYSKQRLPQTKKKKKKEDNNNNDNNNNNTDPLPSSSTTTTTTSQNDSNDMQYHFEDIENPKGRIISIGGKVTWEKLSGHPDHIPRFRAICEKPFFIIPQQRQQRTNDNDDNDDDDDDDERPTWQYKIAASAEGRTRFEAERIASLIVWQHVMNMTTIPTSLSSTTSTLQQQQQQHLTTEDMTITTKLLPYVTNDIPPAKLPKKTTAMDNTTATSQEDWFDDMNENDPIFDNTDPQVPEPVQPKLSAKARRRLRTLKNATVRHISQFDIRDTQDNFLQFQLTDHEQPYINLRPGGESVIESWYRGALNPLAAFHRALIAPHVFPNHIGTVNAFTRHNILPNITGKHYHDSNDQYHSTDEEVFIDHRKQHKNELLETDSIPLSNDDDNLVSDTATTSPLVAAETEESIITSSSSSSSSSKKSSVVLNPFDDPNIEIASRRDKKYKRTFTVLAFVVPNLQHPLLANMKNVPDYNTNELLTKCFVEHGYNVRDTRNAIGIQINRYIIDVLLKNYEDLDDKIEQEKREREQQRQYREGLNRQDRKRIFFKF